FRLVGGEGADRDRVGCVEAVVLNNNDGAWLPSVVHAASDGPDLAPPHSPQSDTASINACSSWACALVATANDWRCASDWKDGARTSGTQIWIGRRPCARSRSRCCRTFVREGWGFDTGATTILRIGYM